jgi:hypothetical protein
MIQERQFGRHVPNWKAPMSSTASTDLELKQLQQFDGAELAASVAPRSLNEGDVAPSQAGQMQQQTGGSIDRPFESTPQRDLSLRGDIV